MDPAREFSQIAIALGLGLLVGLQRERTPQHLAGLRTFPLITLLGVLSGILSREYGGWVVGAGFVAVSMVLAVSNYLSVTRSAEVDPGTTTEVAALMMYAIGAYLASGNRTIAVALGAGVAVLLQFKGELHGVARRLSDNDVRAIMQFALVSMVILPVLPDRAFGPYAVLNPREIWLMVVLIVGIGLVGYIAQKFLTDGAGLALTGFLGGLVSSTATTVAYARAVRADDASMARGAIVILLASSVVFVRLVVIIGVVSPQMLGWVAAPLAVLFGVLAAGSGIVWLLHRRTGQAVVGQEPKNPTEIRWALVFALVYAGVLFAVAAARALSGDRALYVVAAISGLTDVDAITLSTAQLANAGRIPPDTMWRAVVVASVSNLVAKTALVGTLGTRRLAVWVAAPFAVAAATGLMLLSWLYQGA